MCQPVIRDRVSTVLSFPELTLVKIESGQIYSLVYFSPPSCGKGRSNLLQGERRLRELLRFVKQLLHGGTLLFSSMLVKALLRDILLLAGSGASTQEHEWWGRLLAAHRTTILPFLESSGIKVESSGAPL